MSVDTFELVGFEEPGGVRNSGGRLWLACGTDGGGKLVLWGRPTDRRNIDAVLAAGVPCTVRCDWREPAQWASERFGHTYWVPYQTTLEFVGAGANSPGPDDDAGKPERHALEQELQRLHGRRNGYLRKLAYVQDCLQRFLADDAPELPQVMPNLAGWPGAADLRRLFEETLTAKARLSSLERADPGRPGSLWPDEPGAG